MRTDALLDRYEVFVGTATVGAHANSQADGFRQRDVRFLVELFSNWMDSVLQEYSLPVQNTQISRYIDELVREGYARKLTRKTHPRYRLTRVGLIDLISKLVHTERFPSREYFFFLFYFIENYKARILEVIRAEGKQFPYPLQVELEALLDTRALVEREVSRVEQELRILEERITKGNEACRLAARLFDQGASAEEVVRDVEKRYPYSLNSQKPQSELYSELRSDHAKWELREGGLKRGSEIWTPTRDLRKAYLAQLRKLARE